MKKKPVKRPTIISVIGILNIVLGGLGLFTSICCVLPGLLIGPLMSQMPMPQGPGKPPMENPFGAINAIPGYVALQCATIGMGVVTGSLLLTSGIGFLKMKPWSRSVTFAYVVVAIVWAAAAMVIQQVYITPGVKVMSEKIQASTGQPNPFLNNGAFMAIGPVIGLVTSLVLPITLLILMLLPAVKLGLAGKVDPAWQPDGDTVEDAVEPDETAEQ